MYKTLPLISERNANIWCVCVCVKFLDRRKKVCEINVLVLNCVHQVLIV